jgi:hypothetical protein
MTVMILQADQHSYGGKRTELQISSSQKLRKQ